jgi:hypothetical protein
VSPGAIKSELNGVAAVATDDVWAVGDDADEIGGDAMHTLVEHWDGTAWARVQSPTPKGRNQTLTGISAVAADDIWAVGRYSALDLSQRTLILHYDGRRWHRVASPNVGDTSTLSSVTTISSEDAWAAGSYFDAKARSYPPLLLHWDGSDWTRVKEAAPGGQRSTGLTGISADTATDIWASGWRPRGHGFVEHGDGQSWSFADAPAGPALFGVSALTATDVWTVGKAYQGGRAVAEHWDGVTWTVDDRLFAGDAYLSAVDALAAGDVWAVGAYADGSRSRTLLMHFDGQGWTHP